MNTIKKTTLIAVITTMAAIAVPSMASAAGWAPLNTNKTLTSTGAVVYDNQFLAVTCSNSTLGVHVRLPASSTLDITSASFTNCTATQYGGSSCGGASVTATGLPWAATSSGAPNVTFTEHLEVIAACYSPQRFNIDGPVTGTYTNATHTLSVHPTSPMALTVAGAPWGPINNLYTHSWHETTNTLTLT
jgi:hypothetical protein